MTVDATDLEQSRRRARLAEWIGQHGGHAAVARERRLTPSQASYLSQLTNGYSFGPRSARKWETLLGMPGHWLDLASAGKAPPAEGLAHQLMLDMSTVPPKMAWEQLMGVDEVPQRFGVAMPDDALSPNVPRGAVLYFAAVSSEKRPSVGDGVLVQDGAGKRYIRRLGEGPGDEWTAQAIHPAYITLESQAHGLRILAVMTGREGSKI